MVNLSPPADGPPPRRGPRNPGDAWVEAQSGERYWGRFGAAGLVALDPARGVLLQHRVAWSHHGGTWGIPGGARHLGEAAVPAAFREAAEEAGVPEVQVRARATSVLDLDVWTYTTVVADVIEPFEPTISDPESLELAWVPVDQVDSLPLHPGFAASWPGLRALRDTHPTVIVDLANVMGSVPDGWWRDRAGAAARWLSRVAEAATMGVPAEALGLAATVWFPRWVVVAEGAARAVDDAFGLELVRAAGSGDDAIVAQADEAVLRGETVTVVTSDRELSDRVSVAGATVRGTRWLRDLLPG